MMEITRHKEIEQQVLKLSEVSRPGAFYPDARELAISLLGEGYSRGDLLDAFDHVRGELRERDREDHEDEILEVMDDLEGWCSSHTRI